MSLSNYAQSTSSLMLSIIYTLYSEHNNVSRDHIITKANKAFKEIFSQNIVWNLNNNFDQFKLTVFVNIDGELVNIHNSMYEWKL